MANDGWVVVVLEHEDTAEFVNEVAYIKGPFDTYEAAEDWANTDKDCDDGRCQITFLEKPDSKQRAA